MPKLWGAANINIEQKRLTHTVLSRTPRLIVADCDVPFVSSPCVSRKSIMLGKTNFGMGMLGVLVALLPVSEAAGQTLSSRSSQLSQQVADRLAQFISSEIEAKNIPAFSIALVDGDEIIWAKGFGFADPQTNVPATAETIYRVGSVSKLLNDVAVVQLVQQGRLDLDADIRRILPGFAPANPFNRPVTLRQLMNHTSGLVREPPRGNYFDPTEPTLAQTIESLNQTQLIYPPGHRTKYSNAAVSVAGYTVEKASQTPYADYMKQSLLDPLGMTSSSYVADAQIEQRLAKAEMWSYDGRRFPAPTFALGTIPAGNLYSSVIDLGHFMRAIFNDGRVGDRAIISPALMREMLSPQTSPDGQRRSYGIGFRLGQLDGHRTFEHGGAVYGYATQFRGLTDHRLGVIAIASLDVANGFVSRVTDDALRMMLAAKRGQPIPEMVPSKPVKRSFARRVAGFYANGEQQRRLMETGGRLILTGATYDQEIRQLGDGFVIDDVLQYGGPVQFGADQFTADDKTWRRIADELPPPPPPRWNGLIGEYGWDHNTMFVYERNGQLWTLIEWVFHYPLTEVSPDVFAFPNYGLYHDEHLKFFRDTDGRASYVVAAEVRFDRRRAGPDHGDTFKIKPMHSTERLRQIALAADPPVEAGEFLEPDLVDVSELDASIKLDIRYATTNNFMGSVFYQQPRALLQRPAAKALVEAHRQLQRSGYGLLIHDAYRPWFVTKMFWDATPPEMKHFVADPQRGSRHNRGCAVDLTLYDLQTGQVVPMVAGYDEFSERAYPDYRGGTSRQRWHRRLLRSAMEQAGFEIYEYEWWHFDHHTWQHYPILNQRFSDIGEQN